MSVIFLLSASLPRYSTTTHGFPKCCFTLHSLVNMTFLLEVRKKYKKRPTVLSCLGLHLLKKDEDDDLLMFYVYVLFIIIIIFFHLTAHLQAVNIVKRSSLIQQSKVREKLGYKLIKWHVAGSHAILKRSTRFRLIG
jgi:hypothetical protein